MNILFENVITRYQLIELVDEFEKNIHIKAEFINQVIRKILCYFALFYVKINQRFNSKFDILIVQPFKTK